MQLPMRAILGDQVLKDVAAGKNYVIFSTESNKLFAKGKDLYHALANCRVGAVEDDLHFEVNLKIHAEHEIVDLFAAKDAVNVWINVQFNDGEIKTYSAGKTTNLLGTGYADNTK